MLTVINLVQMQRIEANRSPKRPSLILFCRPDGGLSSELCSQFRYIHEDSGSDCSIYCAGYAWASGCDSDPFPLGYSARPLPESVSPYAHWWYSDKAYSELKKELELRMNVKYKGGLAIAALHPGSGYPYATAFDYERSVLLDGESLVASAKVGSPIELMQRLIDSTRADEQSHDFMREANRLKRSERLYNLTKNRLAFAQWLSLLIQVDLKEVLDCLVQGSH